MTAVSGATLRDGGNRPPRAEVGSEADVDEQIFGALFDGKVVRRFGAFVRPYAGRLYLAMGAVLVFTLTQLAIPLTIRRAIDDALLAEEPSRSLLGIVTLGLVAVISINFVANFVQLIIVGRTAEHVLFDMRRAMYAHLQHVSLSFMDKTQVGRLMSRLQGDVNALQEFLETSVFAIGDLVLLAGIVAVLLALDWKLGLLTLAVVPTLFAVRVVWLPRARKAFLRARETSSLVNGALAESINGVRTVQGMARESVNFQLFDDRSYENLQTHLKASQFAQVMVPTVDTLTGFAMAVVVIVGGNLVLNDTLDVGVMVAFMFYVQRFFDPIRSLTMQYSVMQRAMASGQRVFEVLDVPVDITDAPDARDLRDADGSVEFRNVTFGYAPGQPVLKNVSFRVKSGETVALVGPTGSGKTSTMALVHRFYDVWDGAVLVGGEDVRNVTQDSLGRAVAMVLQEPYLFSGTVAANIRYRESEASQETVERAARTVGAHDFIMQLPDGYETLLEQRGSNLSLGQRQLISFARAIVADAKILVLDEATASIDSYTERQIQTALKRLLDGRTALVIAHRLATIRGADKIIVLQDGEVIESGDHQTLIARRGLYAKLYAMNYASFDDLAEDLKGPA